MARGLLAIVLVVVTVVALGLSAVLFDRQRHLTDDPFSLSNSGQVIPRDSEQHRVIATAEQFCLRVDAFDGDNPDAYRTSVTALLTTKYKADFEKEFAQIQQLGVQKGAKGKGTILASGIASIDNDSATVLVVHDNTITSAGGSGQQHSRWTVNLNKVDGRWLVDDFTPVS